MKLFSHRDILLAYIIALYKRKYSELFYTDWDNGIKSSKWLNLWVSKHMIKEVNDILIGKVGIIGIYKGEVEEDSIKNMIDIVDKSKKETENRTENIEIVDSDDMEKDNEGEKENLYHYLDIIAIIQELHIENKGEK